MNRISSFFSQSSFETGEKPAKFTGFRISNETTWCEKKDLCCFLQYIHFEWGFIALFSFACKGSRKCWWFKIQRHRWNTKWAVLTAAAALSIIEVTKKSLFTCRFFPLFHRLSIFLFLSQLNRIVWCSDVKPSVQDCHQTT